MKDLRSSKNDILPLTLLTSLPGWQELDPATQKTIGSRTAEVNEAGLGVISSRMLFAERWAELYEVLNAHRMFSAFCEAYGINRSTVLNYVNGHTLATAVLPDAVYYQAAIRGKNMIGRSEEAPLGIYTAAVKKLPPPNTKDTATIVQWLGDVEELRKKLKKKEAEKEPDVKLLLKGSYRSLTNIIEKVPSRRKRPFLQSLVGMLLTEIGISSPLQFEPEGIPEDFPAVVGRPSNPVAA